MLGPKLSVVDEIGYLPFGRGEAIMFFNVVARRYERGSIVLTSDLPFTQRAGAFPEDQTQTRSSPGFRTTPTSVHHRRELPAQGQAQGGPDGEEGACDRLPKHLGGSDFRRPAEPKMGVSLLRRRNLTPKMVTQSFASWAAIR